MIEPNRDIDKLLEATTHLAEEGDSSILLFPIDIDRLLDRTQDW